MRLRGLALAALMLSGTAYSAPIRYDEAVDGDLANSISGVYLELGVGANTISGAFHPTNLDGVEFRVPEGTALVRIQLLMPRRDFPGILSTSFTLQQTAPSIADLGSSGEISLPTTDFDFVNVFSFHMLGAGDYFIRQAGMVHQGISVRPHPYTWKLIVRSVPEPATLVLLGLGLLGIVYVRRMKSI